MIEKGVESLLTRNLRAAFASVPHEWKIEDEREAKRGIDDPLVEKA